jgi:heavy metal sensor kinase
VKGRLGPFSVRTRLTLWYTGLLVVILIVIGGLSYRVLAWSLTQDVDASLVTVARVISDLHRASSELPGEAALGELVGPEFYDKFFQFLDPRGQPADRSASLRHRSLPLSARARENAARGQHTFETISLDRRERVRLLTMPIEQAGQPAQLIQVGIPLKRVEGALRRYLQIVVALVPLGVGLAAVGGAVIARAALAPVEEMARSARRITAEALGQRIATRGANDELDYLAETLNGMLGRLEEAFGQMRRFTADAAHELRTPLTALKGGIEVALRASRSVGEYREVLTASLEEVNRLIRVAEDLLLLSRSSTDAGIRRERVELQPLLLETLDIGIRLARETGVVMSLSGITPAQVIGSESALRRALLNLVENAVKYTPAGGRVELSLAREGPWVFVAVEDTGIGIDAADAERIFEPFVRLDEARSRETGGSGLGLTIARSVVVAHGGTLSLESAPKAGSRFTVRLPAV